MRRRTLASVFRRRKRRNSQGEEIDDEEEEDYHHGGGGSRSEDDPEILPPPNVEGEMPTYFHVGGLAKECLIRGYKYGIFHLECSTSTDSKIGLTTYGSAYPDLTSIFGGVEVRKQFGAFHLAHNWLTTNEFLTEAGVTTPITDGILYALIRASYSRHDSFDCKAKVKTGLEYSPIKMEFVIPVLKEPRLMGYIVGTPATNWILGYRAVYNMDAKGFDKHAFCVGYNDGSTEVGLKLENFHDVRGSLFQRFGEKFALALKMNLYGGGETRRIAFGGQYQLDSGSMIKAKVREDGYLGLLYQSKLSENMEIIYHLGFEGKSPIKGDHKIGVAWLINA